MVKRKLINFYKWLTTEAPKKSRGKVKEGEKKKIVGTGLSVNTSRSYIAAIMTFYNEFGFNVKLIGRQKLPKAQVENKRLDLTNLDVKRLVEHARSLRDRAIILTMFQSGVDAKTLCELIYEDVAKGIDSNEHPLKLYVFRGKNGVEAYSFLGHDAIEAIKAYINDMKTKGIIFNGKTPLFLKHGPKAKKAEALTSRLVQNVLRITAKSAGFIDEKLNGHDISPLSPHTLRKNFASIMLNKGVPDSIVDFWLAHNIGTMNKAYKNVRFEDLKQMYLEREKFISISTPNETVKKFEEFNKKHEQMNSVISNLSIKNEALTKRLLKVEGQMAELKEIGKTVDFLKFHYEVASSKDGFGPEIEELAKEELEEERNKLEKKLMELNGELNKRNGSSSS